ncbi:MAG: cell division protein FtsW, partial [Clostridia bacterium]|nr:cell division protein FtsW [Clostridia bacterium]
GYLAWPYLPQYIKMRVLVVFDHALDPLDKGFHQTRSVLAIGSGQLTGQGYLSGTQTQSAASSALPARHTDFIFSVAGEELGLLGCLLIIALLLTIILRCVWVSRTARSPVCAYAAMGFAGMLMIQTVLNIGMCLFVSPVVGLTLPFFSSGGSSILTLYAAMGIVSGIKMRSLPSWLRDRSNI